MDPLRFLSIKAKNLKCFGEQPQGFESILPFNIIIGRNNTGKTTLLDLIALANKRAISEGYGHKGRRPEAEIGLRYNSEVIEYLITDFKSLYQNQNIIRRSLDGSYFVVAVGNELGFNVKQIRGEVPFTRQFIRDNVEPGIQHLVNPLFGATYLRLSADRDIRPEAAKSLWGGVGESELSASGEGATRIIHRMLHNSNKDHRYIIRNKILGHLKEIYGEDGRFFDIHTQVVKEERADEEHWEVNLDVDENLPVPLSKMGSGVKTILLVLLMIDAIPEVVYSNREMSNFIFGFEELENNLHPAIQRRLFEFLRGVASREKCRFIVTTHSHVVIDMFSRDPDAQILHVTHGEGGDCGKVVTVSDFRHHSNIFRDLDVRASDLLQSNCVAWMEGPSDRTYFNRWIELWDPELKEGTHYQCLYTGGRLIEGYSFGSASGPTAPDGEEEVSDEPLREFIEALKINRHAVVMMDRDRGPDEPVKPWVGRIEIELNEIGGMPWITDGREVENYIPADVLDKLVADGKIKVETAPGPHDNFFERVSGPWGGKLGDKKTELAKWASDLLTVAMIEAVPGLAPKVVEACDHIREWNGLPPCPRRAPEPNPGL